MRGTSSRHPVSCPVNRSLRSDASHVLCCRPLTARPDLKAHPLTITQRFGKVVFHSGRVDEDVPPTLIALDEAEALLRVKPLHRSRFLPIHQSLRTPFSTAIPASTGRSPLPKEKAVQTLEVWTAHSDHIQNLRQYQHTLFSLEPQDIRSGLPKSRVLTPEYGRV